MRTILVTGSDTGVGKTHVVAALVRLLATGTDARVQIVKVVETGRGAGDSTDGDAEQARRLSGTEVLAVTLLSFAEPLAPASAARIEGARISFAALIEKIRALPACDWRILEGAGGIATPLDEEGRDWADFAVAVEAEATVLVVPDRLGAINQARLAHARAAQRDLHAGVWLNAAQGVPAPAVAASNRESLAVAGITVFGELAFGSLFPAQPEQVRAYLLGGAISEAGRVGSNPPVELGGSSGPESQRRIWDSPPFLDPGGDKSDGLSLRVRRALGERDRQGLRRTLRVTDPCDGVLNLADNDYLVLARDPAVAAAVVAAVGEHGTSASASPLISGWRVPHERLLGELCAWQGFPCGLLWNSGYTANSAVLSLLLAQGDLVFADRLIHHSMIAGLLRSGARLRRYEHLRLDQLEEMLTLAAPSGRTVFVVTESVFSMDGGFPDFEELARLKQRYGFRLIVDEAHALGWYGFEGAGLVRAAGVESSVDVLIGTLGKTLASGGAYTLFRDTALRDYLANFAGEFVYSTALPPLNAVAASAALVRVRALAPQQAEWRERSRNFRAHLRAAGWDAPAGDSPVVPILLGSADLAVAAAGALRQKGILAAAVRPPTVPAGTSRLRFSLKRTFDDVAAGRVLAALAEWKASR